MVAMTLAFVAIVVVASTKGEEEEAEYQCPDWFTS